MAGNNHALSIGASMFGVSNRNINDDLNTMLSNVPTTDDNEADTLNDETFGDCDLNSIKKKSDFDENGEFLGDYSSDRLPDFFDTNESDNSGNMLLTENDDDQSQQPSIDALLGEDPMSISTPPIHLRQSSMNPLFNMAISQASAVNQESIFSQRLSPAPQPQINYQLLKQIEQLLITQQIPAHERTIYLQAMLDKMQRDVPNTQRPQQQTRMPSFNNNGYEVNSNRSFNDNTLFEQRQTSRPMPIGEMMERARLSAMNLDNPLSQSPTTHDSGVSVQFMDAIQRSDQIPIVDKNHKNQFSPSSSTPPLDAIVSPSPSSTHHHNHPRQNRPSKHYPRPPLLNTWQGRGPGHDEFAGMMSDREKQWVVKIQLHQVSQTPEEDFYFQQWSQKHRNQQNTQSTRHHHRTQKISYPVLQLLKSIQQENELAQRLSQTSTQVTFSNVNPAQSLPYASPISTQLGKQSTATPRHPRCTLHLDGQFSLGTRTNAITHDKYNLGILLHIEDLYRDLLQISSHTEKPEAESKLVQESSDLLKSIIDRYFNHEKYLFADIFGLFNKGQIILERLYRHMNTEDHLKLAFIRFYSSLSYMIRRCSTEFHIQPSIINTINLIEQQMIVKQMNFEQLLVEMYDYYEKHVKAKLTEIHSVSTNSDEVAGWTWRFPVERPYSVTLFIELLLILERQCYSASTTNALPILQQLQPQLQYQLTEHIRLFINDVCQALIACSPPSYVPRKLLKPLSQTKHQQFGLLCKFLRIQTSQQVYAMVESKLVQCCIKDP